MATSGNLSDVPEAPVATHENVFVDGVLRYPSTGVKVVIVGGGPGGYFTALECWRKGHDVEVLEKNGDNSPIGDSVFLSPSGLATLKDYPNMLQDYLNCSWDCITSYRKLGGELVSPLLEFEWNRPDVPQHSAWPLRIRTMVARAGMNSMLYNQALRLGIPVTFNVNIVDYVENADGKTATAVADDGRRFTGDIVVAADGLGTKTIKNSPIVEKALSELKRSELRSYSGDHFHCVSVVAKDIVLIGLTTQDDGSAAESWSTGITTSDFLARLPNTDQWDPLILELIRNIPDNQLVSWKLCWRDPQSKWTTPGGRILQLGDSAHAFVPSSIMGATTALEDSQSLAECLRLAGKEEANIGVKIHELLRLQRVSILQRLGVVNRREMHHDGGMEDTFKNATASGPMGMAKWIWTHNAGLYANERFSEAKEHLKSGSPFEHRNIPKGFKWEPWSMEEEMEKERQGIVTPDLKMNGDWSIY